MFVIKQGQDTSVIFNKHKNEIKWNSEYQKIKFYQLILNLLGFRLEFFLCPSYFETTMSNRYHDLKVHI